MAEHPSLDRRRASSLLSPPSKTVFAIEEQLHPWHTNRSKTFNMPLLRIWDHCSGSQPDENRVMMSRAPDQRLDTIKLRKTTLTTHINHGIWEPTPYISFTSSPRAVQDLANMRSQRNNRGNQTLTVIDPNTRLKNGLPILNVADEMSHYKILDPYGKANQYYDDHYVCLWQVTEKEIVGHWRWDGLVAKENWYQTIITAFLQFRAQTMSMVPRDEISDLTAGLNQLSCRAMI